MRNLMTLTLAVVLVAAVFVQADIDFTPYGLAQYRLRTRINSAYTDDVSETVFNYANTISYYAGFKANVSEQFSFQMQIGNDWVFTEDVNFLNNNPVIAARQFPPGSIPYFHLAYAQWNPGAVNLSLGIVPVISYGPLDLIERSLSTGSYATAAFFTWPVITNNSFMGLKLGVPILKGDVALDVNLLSSVIDSRFRAVSSGDQVIEDPNKNPTSAMFVLDLPFKAGAFSLTPQFVGIVNRNYNSAREEGDHELSGGLTAAYKLNDKTELRTFGAYAQVDNLGSRNDKEVRSVGSESVTIAPQYENVGVIAGIGATFGMGPGSLVANFNYSYSEDLQMDNSDLDYLYFDLMYNWNVHKNLTITPRVRNFTTLNPDDSNITRLMEIRPELMLTAKF